MRHPKCLRVGGGQLRPVRYECEVFAAVFGPILCRKVHRQPTAEMPARLSARSGGASCAGGAGLPSASKGGIAARPDEELTAFAKKVPKVKPCADQQLYQQRLLERGQFMKICDTLAKNPDYIMQTWSWLQDYIYKKNSPDSAPGPGKDLFWPDSYTYISRLPKYWLAEFLAGMSDREMSLADFELIDGQDPEAVGKVFRMALQVAKTDPLPRVALERRVTYRMFEERYAMCGKRLVGWKRKAMAANGTIDWLKGGVYTPVVHEAKVVQVRHVCGDVATIPDYLTITSSFSIQHAWDDTEACFAHGLASFRIMDMFEANMGPKKHKLSKKAVELKTSAEHIKAALDEAEAETLKGTVVLVGEDFGKDQVDAKRKAALEKARERVKRQKLERKSAAHVPIAPLVT